MKPSHSQRPQRRRKALQFVATMLVALGVIAFAASIALGASARPAPEWVTICHGAGPHGKEVTLTVNKKATNGHFDNNGNLHQGDSLGACVNDTTPPGYDDITVCRNGATTVIKENEILESDVDGACIVIDTDIQVCRGGVLTTIKSLTRQAGDTDPPCATSDPDIVVCRSGATTTIKTSAKLPTDTDGACPDTGLVPGSADGGGPVDNAGVDVDRDNSLAPTGAQLDPAATSGEQVIPTATAGAADGPTTIAGADETSAVVTPNGSLPYTGLSTLQVALMGVMLLGLGSLAWLVGSAPRPEDSLAAA